MLTPRLLIASGNRHKVREIRALLEGLPAEVLGLEDLPFVPEEPEETGATFTDNALLKARYYSGFFEGCVLADDSGLIVPALGGAPGVLSARYAGSGADDEANRRKLLESLRASGFTEPAADFVCVLCFAAPGQPPAFFLGRWPGRIASAARGTRGFGYDPLFIPEGHSCTVAELSPEEKNRLSHRGQALAKFRGHFAKFLGRDP